MTTLDYPTDLHRQAVEVINAFFLDQPDVDTILLTNSLARGVATPDSDIDLAVLAAPLATHTAIAATEQAWEAFLSTDNVLKQYKDSNPFAQIHLDVFDGVFRPAVWEDGGPIDFFEVEIGNRLLYARPLSAEGAYFAQLKAQWLPYYGAALQQERLVLAKKACLYELAHIPVFVKRALYFQAFDRLYIAFQKFLQALFIKHKTYPIAYNKWIKYQITEILRLPELYKALPQILSVTNIEGSELNDKAVALNSLLEEYI